MLKSMYTIFLGFLAWRLFPRNSLPSAYGVVWALAEFEGETINRRAHTPNPHIRDLYSQGLLLFAS